MDMKKIDIPEYKVATIEGTKYAALSLEHLLKLKRDFRDISPDDNVIKLLDQYIEAILGFE